MRVTLIALSAVMAVATATGAVAQSRSLPKGSSLAATPPIDQRNKQFHALSKTQQRHYLRQGYQPHKHPY